MGGGGHCRSVIDVIEAEGRFRIAGIVDAPEKQGKQICGYPIMATDDDLPMLVQTYLYFLVTVGQVKSGAIRTRLFQQIEALGGILPTIISPTAYVSKHASIGAGTVIMHRAFVNAGARVGVNCIINTAALVEHDAQIGDCCHISTGAIVNGTCVVSDGCFVGSNAVLAHGIRLAPNGVIGAGAVVLADTQPNGLYAGSPAILKRRSIK